MAVLTTRNRLNFLGSPQSIRRNALLSFINQGSSMVAAFVSMPFLLKFLGTERVGLVTIIWVIIGYFSVLDLGMSVAVTRNVAFSLGAGRSKDIPAIFWSGVMAQCILGFIGCGTIILLLPLIFNRFLTVSPLYAKEAYDSFIICALSFPLILVSTSFVGLLQAAKRFDLTAKVQIPAGILQYMVPISVSVWFPHLHFFVTSLIVTRVIASLFLFNYCIKVIPDLRRLCSFKYHEFVKLLNFGGWITIGNLINPIILYSDRFIVGSILTMTAVAYYTVPNEAVMKLTFISGSFVAALFPALSSLFGKHDYSQINAIARKAMKWIFFGIAFIALPMWFFSYDLIRIWIGTEFADNSTNVFRILLIGLVINSIARIPYSQIQAMGAAKITAIIQLIELPIQLALAYFLVKRMGLEGAAISWTLRIALDLLLLLFFSKLITSKHL